MGTSGNLGRLSPPDGHSHLLMNGGVTMIAIQRLQQKLLTSVVAINEYGYKPLAPGCSKWVTFDQISFNSAE